MSISILNRGASGGLKPELTVTAPAGSTIDLLWNGIIVDTYTLSAEETSHTFAVKVGVYTVRGTLETKTAETEVVIDAVGQYAVEIDYKLWLYREGDECKDVTGGWTGYNMTGGGTNTFTKNADNLYIYLSGTYKGVAFSTNNAFSAAGYSKLYIDIKTNSSGVPRCGLWTVPTIERSLSGFYSGAKGAAQTTRGIISVDIEGTGDLLYGGLAAATSTTSDTFAVYLYRMWLE